MTNNQIIQKAWDKAYANGWDFESWKAKYNRGDNMISSFKYTDLLDKDFAKALWGEKNHQSDNKDFDCINCVGKAPAYSHPENYMEHYCWQYHLQQMVIAEDPIKYLGDHI